MHIYNGSERTVVEFCNASYLIGEDFRVFGFLGLLGSLLRESANYP